MTGQTLEIFVWTIFFAILAAVLYTCLVQHMLTGLVGRLLKQDAETEQTAKTLPQLGYHNALVRALVKVFAKGGSPLARAIKQKAPPASETEDSELLFAEKAELAYYLPKENRTKSFEKHFAERVPLVKTAVLLLLLALVAFAASSVIRFLGNWANATVHAGSKNHAYGNAEREDSLLDEQEKLNEQERIEQEKAKKDDASEPESTDAANTQSVEAFHTEA